MKGPLDRTKVVLRHLPHTISQSALMEQIDARFSGRYNWFSFRSGKQSLKCQSYSRAYIDFKQPEDVIEFAEFFDGHVFVNEKGTQFKTIVEYAPSQRVPKQWSKKDGREGTIVKDPEYLEFLESVSKPVENLPSAEIQLERKEAERAGAGKEAPIVTALMDFIRQKRAAKGGPRRSLPNGKLMRRGTGASSSNSNSTGVKRGSEKRTSTMYVLREGGKNSNGKEKSTYVKRAEKSSTQSGSVVLDEEKASDTGKKKILLLKGKEKEIPNVTTGVTPQQKVLYGGRQNQNQNQNQRNDGSGRIIRSILLKDTQQNQSLNQDNKDRRPPRPQNVGPGPLSNGLQDDGFNGEKQDKQRSRNNNNNNNNNNNKEKPDRVVWTPLRRSDGLQSDESFLDTTEGTHGESKNDLSNERGRGGQFSSDNGSYKHSGRRTSLHNAKDLDISSNSIEGKSSKRAGYSSHEKRVWVQKPSSGS